MIVPSPTCIASGQTAQGGLRKVAGNGWGYRNGALGERRFRAQMMGTGQRSRRGKYSFQSCLGKQVPLPLAVVQEKNHLVAERVASRVQMGPQGRGRGTVSGCAADLSSISL